MKGKHSVTTLMACDLPFPISLSNAQVQGLTLIFKPFYVQWLLLFAQLIQRFWRCCGFNKVHRVNEREIPFGLFLSRALGVHGIVVQPVKAFGRIPHGLQAVADILGLKAELTVVAGNGLELLGLEHRIGHWRGAVAANNVAIKIKVADCLHDGRVLNHLWVTLSQDALQALQDFIDVNSRTTAGLLDHILGRITDFPVRVTGVIVVHDLFNVFLVPEVKGVHGAGVQRHDLPCAWGQRQQNLVHFLLDLVVFAKLRNGPLGITHDVSALGLSD